MYFYTEYHQPGNLNIRWLFFTVLESGDSSIKMCSIWFLVGALFLACRWSLLTIFSHGGERERERVSTLVSSSFDKATNPVKKALLS